MNLTTAHLHLLGALAVVATAALRFEQPLRFRQLDLLERAHVAIVALELHVDVAVARLYGVNDLGEVCGGGVFGGRVAGAREAVECADGRG